MDAVGVIHLNCVFTEVSKRQIANYRTVGSGGVYEAIEGRDSSVAVDLDIGNQLEASLGGSVDLGGGRNGWKLSVDNRDTPYVVGANRALTGVRNRDVEVDHGEVWVGVCFLDCGPQRALDVAFAVELAGVAESVTGVDVRLVIGRIDRRCPRGVGDGERLAELRRWTIVGFLQVCGDLVAAGSTEGLRREIGRFATWVVDQVSDHKDLALTESARVDAEGILVDPCPVLARGGRHDVLRGVSAGHTLDCGHDLGVVQQVIDASIGVARVVWRWTVVREVDTELAVGQDHVLAN